MEPTIRVAIFDDQPLYRAGLSACLRATGLFDVVASEGTVGSIDAVLAAARPDLVLIEPGMSGCSLGLLEHLDGVGTQFILVVVSSSDAREDIATARRIGAAAYVVKDIEAANLIAILDRVRHGRSWFPRMRVRSAQSCPRCETLSLLTRRELLVLKGAAIGKTNKEIGRELRVTEKTVKHTMSSILQKMASRNRVEAIAVFARDCEH